MDKPQTCNGKRCGWCGEGAEPCHYSAPPAAQDVAGLALIEAGNPLSNAAYNLAQKPGHVLTAYDCELLAELRQRWDAALAAHRAQQADHSVAVNKMVEGQQ